MKNLQLTFVMRVKLADVLACATGSLGKISALQAVYDQVRFTEEELARIEVTCIDKVRGIQTFHTDAPAEFALDVVLEDSHAATLERELNEFQGFRMGDREWVDLVKEQLARSAPKPKMEFKRRRK
jgi:hypothetical protein